MSHLALLGCGLMGQPMARRLLQAGHTLTVWNRTRSKAEALVADGARVADTPAAAVAGAAAVITMLDNGEVVRQVMFEPSGPPGGPVAAEAMATGSLFIDMSSILPAQAQDHAQRLSARGVRALDAPVSGGTLGAECAVTCHIVTSAGREDDRTVTLRVLER